MTTPSITDTIFFNGVRFPRNPVLGTILNCLVTSDSPAKGVIINRFKLVLQVIDHRLLTQGIYYLFEDLRTVVSNFEKEIQKPLIPGDPPNVVGSILAQTERVASVLFAQQINFALSSEIDIKAVILAIQELIRVVSVEITRMNLGERVGVENSLICVFLFSVYVFQDQVIMREIFEHVVKIFEHIVGVFPNT